MNDIPFESSDSTQSPHPRDAAETKASGPTRSASHLHPPSSALVAHDRQPDHDNRDRLAPESVGLCSAMSLFDWRGDLTFFAGINDTRPLETYEALVWDAITKKICPDEPTIVAEKKDAPYFLPCLLRDAPLIGKTLEYAEQNGEPTVGKMRSKEHVTESHVLVYDFDGIDESDFEQLRGFLARNSLTYIAYTTHSHGREEKPGMHVRICIPVDQPLDVDGYSTAWHAFVALLNDALDSDEAQSRQGEA